jgi:hypothetical protein
MIREPFQISANDQHHFDVDPEQAKELDLIPNGEGKFHLIHLGKTYHAELIEADYATRHYTLRINGQNIPSRLLTTTSAWFDNSACAPAEPKK